MIWIKICFSCSLFKACFVSEIKLIKWENCQVFIFLRGNTSPEPKMLKKVKKVKKVFHEIVLKFLKNMLQVLHSLFRWSLNNFLVSFLSSLLHATQIYEKCKRSCFLYHVEGISPGFSTNSLTSHIELLPYIETTV